MCILGKTQTNLLLMCQNRIYANRIWPKAKYPCCFPIKQVATTKSLGAIIDDKLNWNCLIGKLTKKIASGMGS